MRCTTCARCEANAPVFLKPNDGSDLIRGGDASRLVRIPHPAGNVFAGTGTGTGTGDVRECLDARTQFNRWAIGILSTESVGNNGGRKFLRSGFAPPKPPVTAEALRLNPVGSLTRSLGRLDNCGEPLVVQSSGL